MVIFTGKVIYGVALQPRFQLLFLSCVKSYGVMRCLQVRNFGSSVPVRYIPKNSQRPRKPIVSSPQKNDFEEDEHNSLDPNVVSAETSYGRRVVKRPKKSSTTENSRSVVAPVNDLHKKGNHGNSELDVLELDELDVMDGGKIMGRCNGLGKTMDRNQRPMDNLNFNDKAVEEETSDFESLEDTEELVQEMTGKEDSGKLAFQSNKSNLDAVNLAVGYLSRRALTTVQLRKKLIAKRYPLHVVDEVIANFQIRKLLDDCQYAEAFSRSRFSSLSWGPGRIKQALYQKGVSEEDAEKAIKLVFKDGESAEDHQSSIGLSNSSLDQLFSQALKRWLQSQVHPVDKRKSKLIQWLRYRGFNWGVVNVVLKKLESEFPP